MHRIPLGKSVSLTVTVLSIIIHNDEHPTERRSQNLLKVLFFSIEYCLKSDNDRLCLVSLLNAKGRVKKLRVAVK